MYGLVSTGTNFPHTILKIIFAIQKKNSNYFMHIFFAPVDKEKT